MYNTSSVADFGALMQLINAINRRNVVNNPKENVNACDDFITLVIICHFLVVVIKELGMSGLDDPPTVGTFTAHSWMMSDDDYRTALYQYCQGVIADNVHLPLNSIKSDNINDKVQEYATEVMSLGMFYFNYKIPSSMVIGGGF